MRHTPEHFATWLHDQLTARGYNLAFRAGGQAEFVQASGISKATISRILRGEGSTDITVLERIADALGIRLGALLVEAGVIDADELGQAQRPSGRMTADQAADELGIIDPTKRQGFRGVVESLTPGKDAG